METTTRPDVCALVIPATAVHLVRSAFVSEYGRLWDNLVDKGVRPLEGRTEETAKLDFLDDAIQVLRPRASSRCCAPCSFDIPDPFVRFAREVLQSQYRSIVDNDNLQLTSRQIAQSKNLANLEAIIIFLDEYADISKL